MATETPVTEINENIMFMFNKIYLKLMKEIKHKDNDVKTKLKEHYKVFDNKSSEYMEKMLASTEDKKKMFEGLFSDEDVLESDTVKALSLFVDVSVHDIMDKIVKDNVEDRNNFKYYLYVLLVLSYIHDLEDMDNEKKNILLRKTVQLMSTVNDTPMTDEMLEEQLDDILDDDIKTVLRKINRDKIHAKEPIVDAPPPTLGGDFKGLEFLNNSKIGQLAKEISSGIDMNKLNMNDPSEMMNPAALFGSGGENGNMFGDIIQTVGSTITEKINSGEINQEELMNEALGMMGQLNKSGHGDMLSSMMNMMGGVGGCASSATAGASLSSPSNKTRDRLQKKLANKKI